MALYIYIYRHTLNKNLYTYEQLTYEQEIQKKKKLKN